MAEKYFYVHNGLTVGALTVDAATGNLQTSGVFTNTNATASTSTTSGALQVKGGVGIQGDLFVGATGYVQGAVIITTATFAEQLGTSLATITYLPVYITMNPAAVPVPAVGTVTTYGTYNFGSLTDITTYGDYNTVAQTGYYSVNDATGAPGYVEYIGFTGVTEFNRAVYNINYTTASGHTVDIDLYNYQTDAWDTFATYSGSGNWQQFALGLVDHLPYISAANSVTTRIYHLSSGNTSHRTWIDYVALEQSTTGGQGPRGATGATGATGAQGVNTGTTSSFVISNTTPTNSTNTGALQVAGGVGVNGSVYVGGVVTATTFIGALTGTASTATSAATAYALSNTSSFLVGYADRAASATTATYAATAYALSNTSSFLVGYADRAASATTATYAATAYALSNTSSFLVGYADRANTSTSAATAYSLANTASTFVGLAALATTATSAATAYSLANTASTFVGLAALATTATNAAFAYSFNTGTLVTNAVNLLSGSVNATTGIFSGIFTSTNATSATSTITGALQIAGGVGIGGNLFVSGSTPGDGGTSNGSGSAVYIKQNTSWTGAQPWALYVSGYTYLGGFRINAGDGVRGLFVASGQIGFATGDTSSPITFTTRNSLERMRIDTTGTVYIGTTTQYSGEQFAVNGNVYINGVITATQLTLSATTIALGAVTNADGLQGAGSVTIGNQSGKNNQGSAAVAIGQLAGQGSQGNSAVAIGASAGSISQGIGAVAIGVSAGQQSQGAYSVAIGYNAGNTVQTTGSIIISAGQTNYINTATNAGLYITPVRTDSSTSATTWGLYYNPATKELTTSSNVGGTFSPYSGIFTSTNTTNATSTNTGALQVAGGVGIGGNVNIGGTVVGGGIRTTSTSTAPTSPTSGDIWYDTTSDTLYRYTNDGVSTYWLDITGPTSYAGDGVSVLHVLGTTQSVSSTTGALIVDGGVGIGKDLQVAGNIYSNGTPLAPTSIEEFTATANQTTFTISAGYAVGSVLVFANGIQLGNSDFTALNGTTVVVNTPRVAGDIVRTISGMNAATGANPAALKAFSVAMSVALS